jgi:hypothetical protein
MERREGVDSGVYQAYRVEIESTRLPRATRSGAAIVFLLNTAFVALDYLLFPSQFWSMLGIRAICNLVMAAIFLVGAQKWAIESAFVGVFAVGLMLLEVIRGVGGLTGDYTPGLMLLFLGIPVLLPFSATQATGVVTILLALLGSLPLVSGESVALDTYFLHLGFPLAAGVECVLACAVLDRMRLADFQQRLEIERTREVAVYGECAP